MITGTFTTSATSGAVSVGYTGTAGTLTASPTTSSVVDNNSGVGTRTFNFVNHCTQPVAFAMNGGGIGIYGCTTDADCDSKTNLPGAFACGTTAVGPGGVQGGCFWKNPSPTSGDFVLVPSTGTATVYLTEYSYTYTPPATPENPNPGPVTAVWSGNVAGRTGCTSATPGSCATAYCGSSTTPANGNCAPGCWLSSAFFTSGDERCNQVQTAMIYQLSTASIYRCLWCRAVGTTSASNPYTCGSAGITTNQGQWCRNAGRLFMGIGGAGAPSVSYVWVADQGYQPNFLCDKFYLYYHRPKHLPVD